MLFIVSLAAALILTALCAKQLKKRPLIFYIIAAVISAAAVVLSQLRIENLFVRNYVLAPFTKGAVTGAFWCIVMYTGAVTNSTAAGKKLLKIFKPVRGELSIFTALLTISHACTYGIVYIKRLLDPNATLEADFISTCVIVVILLCVMIPLTIMSFQKVRRKMKPKLWKNIQRAAYIFYALIYVHVLVLYLPRAMRGTDGYALTVIAYTAVWAGYLSLRLRKYLIEHKKPQGKAALNAAAAALFAVPVALTAFVSVSGAAGNAQTDDIPVSSRAVQTAVLTAAPAAAPQVTEPVTGNGETAGSSAIPEVSEAPAETAASSDTDSVTTLPAESETPTKAEDRTTHETSETAEASETTAQHTAAETTAAPVTTAETTAALTTAPPETTPAQTAAAPETTTTTAAPEPQLYNNGTYSGEAYGYDGYIYVTITVENDMITSINSSCEEEDISYYLSCRDYVTGQILTYQNTDVDAVSGATYSSQAIMKAVAKALDSARI